MAKTYRSFYFLIFLSLSCHVWANNGIGLGNENENAYTVSHIKSLVPLKESLENFVSQNHKISDEQIKAWELIHDLTLSEDISYGQPLVNRLRTLSESFNDQELKGLCKSYTQESLANPLLNAFCAVPLGDPIVCNCRRNGHCKKPYKCLKGILSCSSAGSKMDGLCGKIIDEPN